MQTPHTRTLRRPGNKAKAGLAAAAGVAVLLGGPSTFAMWAQEQTFTLEDNNPSYEIMQGGGVFDPEVVLTPSIVWFDTHPVVVAANGNYEKLTDRQQSTDHIFHIGTDGRDYVKAREGTSATYETVSSVFGLTADDDTHPTYNGQQIDDISKVRFVPGDSLLGIYTVTADPTLETLHPTMVGAHLRAKVTVDEVDTSAPDEPLNPPTPGPEGEEEAGGADETGSESQYYFESATDHDDENSGITNPDEITVTIIDSTQAGWTWLGPNQFAVYIEYAANWGETEEKDGIAKAAEKWDADANEVVGAAENADVIGNKKSTLQMKIFSNVKVTVVQVSEAEANKEEPPTP